MLSRLMLGDLVTLVSITDRAPYYEASILPLDDRAILALVALRRIELRLPRFQLGVQTRYTLEPFSRMEAQKGVEPSFFRSLPRRSKAISISIRRLGQHKK